MTENAAPAIEMLWEPDDPSQVLQTRFRFADPAAAAAWVADTLDEHFGVQVKACERIVMSDHNALAWVATPDGPMVAKWSADPERFARLAALAELTAWLDERCIPVSAPVPSLDGRVQVEVGTRSIGLQRRIGGDLLDVDDMTQVHEAGVTLAHLHQVLAAYPNTEQIPSLHAPSSALHEQVTEWLATCPQQVPAPAKERLRTLASNAVCAALPVQLVHGDYRSANILCAGPDVTAVIDLEEARLDHRVVELARSAVMLGTRFHDWGPVPAVVREALRSGYESQHPLTDAESSWWEALVLWYSLLLIPDGEDPTGWGAAAMNQVPLKPRNR